jgi:autotransporter-associated beta strand protein
VVSTIRMAGDNAAYYGDGANSVMNVDTGGVLRVTGKIYITDAAKRGILNFNGGTLEWAGGSNISGWDQYLATSRVGLAVCVKEGGMVVSNDTTFYIEQPVASGANEDGGIVKWGAGTFALVSPNNTFNGPVRVMQGDFTTYSDMINPINTNCEVIVNADCRFRANASKHKFARIGGSGWFIENTDRNLTVWKAIAPGMGADSPGTLGISGGPINIEDGVSLEIDLDENGRSDCLDYYEELDLSKLSLKVNDVAKLDANHRYLIAKNVTAVSGGFKTTNLPDGWKVRYSADSRELKIVPLKGMTLIVK